MQRRCVLTLVLIAFVSIALAGSVQGRLRRWRAVRPPVTTLLPADASSVSGTFAARPRVPAEFEQQSALLLASQQMLREAPDVFVSIAAAVESRLPLIVLVGDADDHREALQLFQKRRLRTQNIHFVELAHDTMWIRDYGPRAMKQPHGAVTLLDADYSRRGRPLDDAVPLGLAAHLKLAAQPVPLCIDGGNLLLNGQGLALATETILDEGVENRLDEQQLAERVREAYGVDQLVLLEPLAGEQTGHVDMFATFTAADTVVVGRCSPVLDPENAQRLDRNAQRLETVQLPSGKRLRVKRVPMPPPAGTTWRSYTNVVYANNAMLVPVYPAVDEAGRREALDTYARLLPGWKIVAIDAQPLAEIGGGLHCVTMNLPGLRSIPAFPLPIKARQVRDDVLAY